jgi:phosphoglycolate/pyridoxal phosphate phosphatase family enzyme
MYFEEHPLPVGKKVYVIGQEGICEELAMAGIPFLGGPADVGKTVPATPQHDFEYDHDVGAVVVGFDFGINYYKIQYAQLCINSNENCLFIATNEDATTHLTINQEWAGNGACVGAIRGCTGREPIVVGKPSTLMLDYIAKQYHIPRNRMCMVGDRLDTDILFGHNNGLQTLLVLSGVTTQATLFDDGNQIKPDFYADSIADILVLT